MKKVPPTLATPYDIRNHNGIQAPLLIHHHTSEPCVTASASIRRPSYSGAHIVSSFPVPSAPRLPTSRMRKSGRLSGHSSLHTRTTADSIPALLALYLDTTFFAGGVVVASVLVFPHGHAAFGASLELLALASGDDDEDDDDDDEDDEDVEYHRRFRSAHTSPRSQSYVLVCNGSYLYSLIPAPFA